MSSWSLITPRVWGGVIAIAPQATVWVGAGSLPGAANNLGAVAGAGVGSIVVFLVFCGTVFAFVVTIGAGSKDAALARRADWAGAGIMLTGSAGIGSTGAISGGCGIGCSCSGSSAEAGPGDAACGEVELSVCRTSSSTLSNCALMTSSGWLTNDIILINCALIFCWPTSCAL
jgi:hypothetical protein